MRWRVLLAGLIASSAYAISFWSIGSVPSHVASRVGGTEQSPKVQRPVRLLAFGDVNLGRVLGQKIYAGDIDYPFVHLKKLFETADIVFVNLESQLSEQEGETQRPGSNLVFTGPSEGAGTLKRSGVTVVATANNHAFDYGKDALFETLANLDAVGLRHAGTARRSDSLYVPALFSVQGISFALFAVTDIMNTKTGWEPYVAFADTARLFPVVRAAASSVDAVIVSYHGGEGFAGTPTEHTRSFA
ncbi:MAG: CapA family protein, partial [Ignavibacteriales bacterium]|nr:CapA family protein [Ignavibacteriales bacterium]